MSPTKLPDSVDVIVSWLMPEVAELDAYRRAAGRALGREITAVRLPDAAYLKARLEHATRGRCFDHVSRAGKLLLFRVSPGGHEVAIRLGMTGRLLLGGAYAADPSPPRPRVPGAWDRVAGASPAGAA